MGKMEKNQKKTTQLSTSITQDLLNEIQRGRFADVKVLPPEKDLAEEFNVSRNIIRECLTRLEREGWITRKHGIGTLINKPVVSARTRLDLNYELLQTIRMTGKTARIEGVTYRTERADAELAEHLQIEEGEEVLRMARMIRANEKPGILCIDYVPARLITRAYTEKDLTQNVFSFLEKFCGTSVETNLAEVRAMPVTKEVSEALEVPMTTALFYLCEVGYDLRSNPVLYSEEYFIDRVIPHLVVRKKI